MANSAPSRAREPDAKAKGKPGPKTKCTKKVQAELLKWLRLGAYRTHACGKARISYRAFNEWEHLAALGEEPFASFFIEVHAAEADHALPRQLLLDAIATGNTARLGEFQKQGMSGLTGDPALMLRLLERRFPREFAERKSLELAGPDGAELSVGPAVVITIEGGDDGDDAES